MTINAEHSDAKPSIIPASPNSEGLVSIIIPFLNAERFLSEAIASILAQTYDNWELLLVNDGSTDRSTAIADRYARELPAKVRCLHHPGSERRGISSSRNLGIANARGNYLAFLDADDVWLPSKLERQVALLTSRPDVGMICGSSVIWHSWTGRTEDIFRDHFATLVSGLELYQTIDLAMLSVREPWSTPSSGCFLLRREAAVVAGGFEDSFDGLFEDQAFYFKLGISSQTVATNECWYKYRQHPDSVCAIAERTGTQPAVRLRFLQWALEYLASSKIARPDLHEALKEELAVARGQSGASTSHGQAFDHPKGLRPGSSRMRKAISKVPGVWSTWHLGRAIRDAWLDSSPGAQPAVTEDFRQKDPWHYTSNDLEIIRHRGEANMLDRVRGNSRFGCALEIGCAEGVFTEILVDRCDSLLATDFLEVALERARIRRDWGKHVTFAQMDLRNDSLPNVFDLIVAIHVVEYIKNPLALRRVREKLVRGLRIGGYLLLGSCTGDNEFREGLWWSRFMLRGGYRINRFFAAHPALTVVDTAIHPLSGSISRDVLLRRIK